MLVLKFIETKGEKTQAELKTDSSTWGNYNNVSFSLIRGKYLIGSTWNTTTTYTKPASGILLTTGATTRNSALNIYDLAGNLREWTLEKTTNSGYPCITRGGGYNYTGSNGPASYRYYCNTSDAVANDSFRSTFY